MVLRIQFRKTHVRSSSGVRVSRRGSGRSVVVAVGHGTRCNLHGLAIEHAVKGALGSARHGVRESVTAAASREQGACV